MHSILKFFSSLLAATVLIAQARADALDTKSGAHLVGRITKIEDGTVYLKTDYAGDISIKQSEVVSFATDEPLAVRFESGARLDGKVAAAPAGGALQVTGGEGTLTTSVEKIAAAWKAGAEDPALTALRRHWTYEASVDVEG